MVFLSLESVGIMDIPKICKREFESHSIKSMIDIYHELCSYIINICEVTISKVVGNILVLCI